MGNVEPTGNGLTTEYTEYTEEAERLLHTLGALKRGFGPAGETADY